MKLQRFSEDRLDFYDRILNENANIAKRSEPIVIRYATDAQFILSCLMCKDIKINFATYHVPLKFIGFCHKNKIETTLNLNRVVNLFVGCADELLKEILKEYYNYDKKIKITTTLQPITTEDNLYRVHIDKSFTGEGIIQNTIRVINSHFGYNYFYDADLTDEDLNFFGHYVRKDENAPHYTLSSIKTNIGTDDILLTDITKSFYQEVMKLNEQNRNN
jgi:hypothetical protein